jgi:DNA-binding NarL/FixJ family response regulator
MLAPKEGRLDSNSNTTLPKVTRILIVDDHPVVRQGLVLTLGREPGWIICGEAESVNDARPIISREKPDLLLLDLDLQGGSGLELIKEVIQFHPEINVLVLSAHDENIYAQRALRAGARGYMMKSERPERLVASIREVLKGEIALSEKMKTVILGNLVGNRESRPGYSIDRLTDRELEVFRMVGLGNPTRGIAEKLSVSVKTVEAHLAHIKQKLGLQTGVELQHKAFHWANKSAEDEK